MSKGSEQMTECAVKQLESRLVHLLETSEDEKEISLAATTFADYGDLIKFGIKYPHLLDKLKYMLNKSANSPDNIGQYNTKNQKRIEKHIDVKLLGATDTMEECFSLIADKLDEYAATIATLKNQ